MQNKIFILDYKMGNLHSVRKKLLRLKAEHKVSSDINDIKKADKIILPGVGHFEKAMNNLKALNMIDTLNEHVLVKQKPILGICLGMQLMAQKSEEGSINGLGWFDGEVVRFDIKDNLRYKVPHTGWNQIKIKKDSPIMKGISEHSEFYFVHSFHYKSISHSQSEVLNESEYEYLFPSAIEKGNIFGVQYHPEKSHDVGEKLLENFLKL